MNDFNGVTSPCVSLRFAGGLYFKLTYRLKPQVIGIKIVTVYRRSIFQVQFRSSELGKQAKDWGLLV